MPKHRPKIRIPRNSGLTLVELLVAVAIAAGLMMVAVISFGVLTQTQVRGGRVDVAINPQTHALFYGSEALYITMGQNANYFQAAQAMQLKDRLMADVDAASAVFCLGRNGLGGVRPAELTLTNSVDLRTVATPSDFRSLLVGALGAGAEVFAPDQSGALTNTNASIFLVAGAAPTVAPTNAVTTLRMVATYEIDFVTTTNPAGTFATVRRYVGGGATPTDFYHAFFADEANTVGGFRPLAAFFGRQGSSVGGAFSVAPNRPFTFVWWPDPAAGSLQSRAPVPVSTPGSPREKYGNMSGRTSLFFVLPAFPAL